MNKSFNSTSIILLFWAVFAGCKPGNGSEGNSPNPQPRQVVDSSSISAINTGPLTLTVYGLTSNGPISGATVKIVKAAGAVDSFQTDINGNLNLSMILNNDRIEISKAPFYPVNLVMLDRAHLNGVKIYLKEKKFATSTAMHAMGAAFIAGTPSSSVEVFNINGQGQISGTFPSGLYNFQFTDNQTTNVQLQYRKKQSVKIEVQMIKDTVKLDVFLNASISGAMVPDSI